MNDQDGGPAETRLSRLEQALGHAFKDRRLLGLALTHSSCAGERRTKESNERLEFLGDSVFNMLTAEHLYRKFPSSDEGRLSKLKSMLVARKSLLELAEMLELGTAVMTASKDGGVRGRTASRETENILADCAEAVIGSLYIDAGLEACKELVINRWISRKKRLVVRDYKSRLQEVLQKGYKKIPTYRLCQCWGPEHSKTFEVEACFEGSVLGRGVGANKKDAEQAAAKEALRNVKPVLKTA